jgi:hypothetical protein
MIAIILWLSCEKIHAQTLESICNPMIHKQTNPIKKLGTFYLEGKPLKATRLLLNLNGKFSSLPIEGIMIPSPKRKIILADTTKPVAKLLYNTEKGKVYALPLDNMRCLVPGEMYTYNEQRQYRQHYTPNFIPNALSKMNIITVPLDGKIPEVKVYPSPYK